MRLLIFEFNGGVLNSEDIRHSLKKLGVSHHTVSYCFTDTCDDDFFSYRFGRVLNEGDYDAVFSINYFPLVAEACNKKGIKYLAWSFDCPLNAVNVEDTMGLETNFVFLFDREHVKGYRAAGFNNVYHLPLAVNCDRMDAMRTTAADRELYGAQVSFVGKLYESKLSDFTALMSDYDRGYIDSVCAAQTDLYGCFLPDVTDMDALIDRINAHYKGTMGDKAVRINREWLFYEIAKAVTRRERLRLLRVLSADFDTKLYSTQCPEALGSLKYMGTCDYLTQMIHVFRASGINLHTTLRYIRSGIPQRVIDILGAGGLCFANYQEEICEHFENGRDLVIYDNVFDAREKAQYYLAHPDEAELIRRSGHERVKESFTYEDRFKTIFRISEL